MWLGERGEAMDHVVWSDSDETTVSGDEVLEYEDGGGGGRERPPPPRPPPLVAAAGGGGGRTARPA